jgi:hypothetical protein
MNPGRFDLITIGEAVDLLIKELHVRRGLPFRALDGRPGRFDESIATLSALWSDPFEANRKLARPKRIESVGNQYCDAEYD